MTTRTTLQFSLLWILTVCLSGTTWASDEEKKPVDISRLVQRLGARSYLDRKEAAEKILKLGHAAEEALKQGRTDSDGEIRLRSQALLIRIQRAEEVERIKRFLSKMDDENIKDFPGWKHFRDLVGDDLSSRNFYVGLLKQDKEMLQALEKETAMVSSAFQEQTEEIYKRMYQKNGVRIANDSPVDREELGLLLLLSSKPGLNISYTTSSHFFRFFSHSEIRKAIQTSKEDPFRRLFMAWVKTQKNDKIVEQLLRRSTYFEKKDLLELSLRIIKDADKKAKGVAFAFPILAQNGTKEHIKLLERFLDSETSVCGFGIGGGFSGSTKVRDVALAMILHLEGQDHKDYNFTYTRTPSGKHLKFNASFQGFTNENERKAAFERYEKWKSTRGKAQEQPKEKS